jgi:excisionase family DNA binding protein
VLEVLTVTSMEFYVLTHLACLRARSHGSGASDEIMRVAYGLQVAYVLNPMKPSSEYAFEELLALANRDGSFEKLGVAPIPTPPGDRLATYGRAITAKELARELGVSVNSIAKRHPCFHVCTCLRFCPVTIARSIQTVFDRSDQPTIIERLNDCKHGMDGYELAALLGVDYKTIMKAKDEGTIPYYREGSLVRFNGRAVARWLTVQMYGKVQPGIALDGISLPAEPSEVPPRKPPMRVIPSDPKKAGSVGT